MTDNQRTSHPYSVTRVAVMLLAAFLFTWLLSGFANAPGSVRLTVCVALMAATLLKQRWVIYAAVAIALFAVSNRSRGMPDVGLSPWDLYFVVILMGYAIFNLRFTDLEFRIRWRPNLGLIDSRDADPLTTVSVLRPLTSGWLWLPLAIAMAHVVMWAIPLDLSSEDRLQINPAGFRAISMLWLLAVLWFLGAGLFSLLADREADPRRARVFARSVWCREWNREWQSIEKRRTRN